VKKYQESVAANKPIAPAPQRATPAPSKRQKVGNKLSFKELRELEELPKLIETLEREQADIAVGLADGAIYRSDAERAKQLQIRNGEIDVEISVAMARWEELEKRRE
jgi:ATP-binding cassette subfamily F protein uup